MDSHTILHEAAKAVPPVTVAALIETGMAQVDLWIKGLTVLYLVLQIAVLVIKWRRDKRKQDDE